MSNSKPLPSKPLPSDLKPIKPLPSKLPPSKPPPSEPLPSKPPPSKPPPSDLKPSKPPLSDLKPIKPPPSDLKPSKPPPSVFPELQSVDPPVLLISTWIFFILGICYLIFKFGIYDNYIFNNILKIGGTDTLPLFKSILVSKLILFIMIFLSITLTILFVVYTLILGGSPENYSNVYGCIFVCFLTTVFITFILLELFPYLVTIFENTIGYSWICLSRSAEMQEFNGLFKQDIIKSSPGNTYEVSFSFLITIMSLYNIIDVLNGLKKNPDPEVGTDPNNTNGSSGQLNTNKFYICKASFGDSDVAKITDLCFIKHSTGHFVWILFASLVCTFTSIKAFSKYLV